MRLKDIALEAGVSVSTVSRVLNDPHSSAASPATQKRIWKIAQEKGYIPNSAAKQLRVGAVPGGAERIIYCIIVPRATEYIDDPFYTTLMASIRVEALQLGYIVEYNFQSSASENISQMDALLRNRSGLGNPFGLIILGRFHPKILTTLRKQFKNLIYIGLNNIQAKCDQIICDGYAVAQTIVQDFWENGHKSIGFIGAHDDSRLEGYRAGLESHGLPGHNYLVSDRVPLSQSGGYQGMLQLLSRRDGQHPITAVFCANDVTAIGALRACQEKGVRVPEDISIMGMNDIEMLRFVSPMLSTVHVPLDEMGSMAVKLLVDSIEGGHYQPVKVNYPYWIIHRESGPVQKAGSR